MIWLASMAGVEEGSVYFEIRDIALRRTGNGCTGVVAGLLGDGQRELWGEVHLSSSPQVQILPQWTDDGRVESFSLAVDEGLLKEQLLDAVQTLFAGIGTLPTVDPASGFEPIAAISEKNRNCLAA